LTAPQADPQLQEIVPRLALFLRIECAARGSAQPAKVLAGMDAIDDLMKKVKSSTTVLSQPGAASPDLPVPPGARGGHKGGREDREGGLGRLIGWRPEAPRTQAEGGRRHRQG